MSDFFFRYLPADVHSAAFGLRVIACGWSRLGPGADYPVPGHPSRHHFRFEKGRVLDEWQLIGISAGSGSYGDDHGETPVSAGDLVVIEPGRWHRYRPDPATGWHEHWVAFDGPLAERWRKGGLLAGGCRSQLASDPLLGHLRTIADIAHRQPPGASLRLAGLTAHCVGEAAALSQQADPAPGWSVPLARLQANLAAHPDRPIDVGALCQELGMSERSIRRAFIATVGKPPKAWHDDLRLEHAHRLLLAGLGVTEVARACGYRSRSAFSRRYRRRYPDLSC